VKLVTRLQVGFDYCKMGAATFCTAVIRPAGYLAYYELGCIPIGRVRNPSLQSYISM